MLVPACGNLFGVGEARSFGVGLKEIVYDVD